MKNLWKFAAALAVIAGAVVIIARFGDKFLAKLQGLRDQCCGVGGCTCGERLADMAGEAADAVHEAVEKRNRNGAGCGRSGKGCRRGRRGNGEGYGAACNGRGLC